MKSTRWIWALVAVAISCYHLVDARHIELLINDGDRIALAEPGSFLEARVANFPTNFFHRYVISGVSLCRKRTLWFDKCVGVGYNVVFPSAGDDSSSGEEEPLLSLGRSNLGGTKLMISVLSFVDGADYRVRLKMDGIRRTLLSQTFRLVNLKAYSAADISESIKLKQMGKRSKYEIRLFDLHTGKLLAKQRQDSVNPSEPASTIEASMNLAELESASKLPVRGFIEVVRLRGLWRRPELVKRTWAFSTIGNNKNELAANPEEVEHSEASSSIMTKLNGEQENALDPQLSIEIGESGKGFAIIEARNGGVHEDGAVNTESLPVTTVSTPVAMSPLMDVDEVDPAISLGIMMTEALGQSRELQLLKQTYGERLRSTLWFNGMEWKSAENAKRYHQMKARFLAEPSLRSEIRKKIFEMWRFDAQLLIKDSTIIALNLFDKNIKRLMQEAGDAKESHLGHLLGEGTAEEFIQRVRGEFNRASSVVQRMLSQQKLSLDITPEWENEKIRWLLIFTKNFESGMAQKALIANLKQKNILHAESNSESDESSRDRVADFDFSYFEQDMPQETFASASDQLSADLLISGTDTEDDLEQQQHQVDKVVQIMAQSAAELTMQGERYMMRVNSLLLCLIETLQRFEQQAAICKLNQ